MKLVGALFIRRNPDGSLNCRVQGASGSVRIATPDKAVLQTLGAPTVCKPVEGIPGQSWCFGSVEAEVDPNTRAVSGLKRWVDANSQSVGDWLAGLGTASAAQTPAPAPQAPAEPAPTRVP